jgi:simple sugar transport system permease protein
MAISILILWIMGYEPVEVFSSAFRKTYLKTRGIHENIVMLIPISLCALAVAFAAKAGLWNIGVEGQFYIGASAATGVALACPNLPAPLLLPFMFIAGAVSGGVLCFISILPRVYWGISEILTTILLNFVVLNFIPYLVYFAWNDPNTAAAQTPPFVQAAKLPIIVQDSRIHLGLIIALLTIAGVQYLMKSTVFGYEMRAVGENPKGAEYAGIDIRKYLFISMFVSGCLAGAAGMLEVSGIVHRLQTNISNDYGFSAFVIAWISRLNVTAILVTGYLFSGLVVSGFKMQMMGFPSSVVYMLKGLILLLVMAAEVLTFYKISWVTTSRTATDTRPGTGAKNRRESEGSGL